MVPLLLLILGHATDAGTPLLALAAHDDHFCDQFCCVYRYCIYFVLYISTLSQVCFVYIIYCALHGWHSSTIHSFTWLKCDTVSSASLHLLTIYCHSHTACTERLIWLNINFHSSCDHPLPNAMPWRCTLASVAASVQWSSATRPSLQDCWTCHVWWTTQITESIYR